MNKQQRTEMTARYWQHRCRLAENVIEDNSKYDEYKSFLAGKPLPETPIRKDHCAILPASAPTPQEGMRAIMKKAIAGNMPEPWIECLVWCDGLYGQPEGYFVAKTIHIDEVDKRARGVDVWNRGLYYITHWLPLAEIPAPTSRQLYEKKTCTVCNGNGFNSNGLPTSHDDYEEWDCEQCHHTGEMTVPVSPPSSADGERRKFMREQAIAVFELTKGFTPEQRDSSSNAFNSMEEMAGYVLELTNESPSSDTVKEHGAVDGVLNRLKKYIREELMFTMGNGRQPNEGKNVAYYYVLEAIDDLKSKS